MFLSFEGIDCSGKSTQARKLVDVLLEAGREVMYIREPGNTTLSESIRALLLDKKNNDMTARTELLLFSASRAQLVETVIRPALENGTIVVCDRYTDSTVAYQAFGRGLPLEDIEQCNAVATGGLLPDLTLYIDIPLDEAHRRAELAGKGGGDRMESAGEQFYQRVVEGYRYLVSTQPERVQCLDGCSTVDELHERIRTMVEHRLGSR
jgi:dTMP kinase